MTDNYQKEELELVLSLLRARWSKFAEPPNDSLRGAFRKALALAAHHQVAPALCDGLRRIADAASAWSDLVPFVQLVEARNLARNKVLYKAVIMISAVLESAEMRGIFLKGAAMVLESENSAPWRLLTDLDILVASDSLNRAVSLLLQQGYHQQADYDDFAGGIHHHYPILYNKESNTSVELHVRVMQDEKQNPIATPDIFQQAVSVNRDGQTHFIPSPEHRMIHLIAHAQISDWGYVLRQILLKDAVDAVELNALYPINWTAVKKSFTDIGAEDELMGFVAAVHQLLDLKHPFPTSEIANGLCWANDAIRALYTPPKSWRTSARVVAHYLRLFARDPARLPIIWETLRDSARMKHLLKTNRQRFKKPE